MKDRFTPGLMAGIVGDIALQIYFLIVKYLGLTDRTYLEYGKVLIMLKQYRGVLAFIIGMTFEFLIGGLLGVILAYLIKYTSSRFYILKAISIGIGSWLFFMAPGTFFDLPLFSHVPPLPAFLMLVGSLLWGVVTAVTLKRLTNDFRSYFIKQKS